MHAPLWMALKKRGNILNLLRKDGGTQKERGVPSKKGGVSTLEETCPEILFKNMHQNKSKPIIIKDPNKIKDGALSDIRQQLSVVN